MTILQDYRIAIYFNNAGIVLLKNHSYKEAKQVFVNAIMAARYTQGGQHHVDNGRNSESAAITTASSWDNSMIERFNAKDNIAQTDQYVSQSTTVKKSLSTAHHHHDRITTLVQVVSDIDPFNDAYNAFLYTGRDAFQDANIVSPIRMESVAFTDDIPTKVDIDFLSSVILYNYAITVLLLTTTTNIQYSPIRFIQANMMAYQLIHSSYSIVSMVASNLEEQAPVLLKKVVALSLFNLKHLSQIGSILQIDHSHLQQYEERFETYKAFLLKEYHLFGPENKILSPPAA